MEMKVFNNKVFVTCSTEQEFVDLKKVLRIWFKDRFGNLRNHILLNFKEKSFPTGYLDIALKKLEKKKIIPTILDNRSLTNPHLFFKKKANSLTLWDHQKAALLEIEKEPCGIIESATGSGKSLVILETFLQKRVKTLIVVPTITIQKALYELFCNSIGKKNVSIIAPKFYKAKQKFIEKSNIGSSYLSESRGQTNKTRIGSSYLEKKVEQLEESFLTRKIRNAYPSFDEEKVKVKEKKEPSVTIICFQALANCSIDFLKSVECVIIDECHHSSSESIRFALLLMENAGYRYGFSATPWRDKKEDELLLISALGFKKLYELDGKKAVDMGLVVKPKYEMIQSPTPEKFLMNIKNWREILEKGIIANKTRNVAIVNKAIELFENGRNVLICVDEISHLEILQNRLVDKKLTPYIVHSLLPEKEKDSAINHISNTEDACISIATMSIGEGADLVKVDAVILASGGKGSVRFLQRIGRGMRLSEGKSEVLVFDFNDWFNPTLSRHSKQRKSNFKKTYEESDDGDVR